MTNIDGAQQVADNMCDAIRGLSIPHPHSPYNQLTVSIGFACAKPQNSGLPKVLISTADDALYQAKKAGRNRVFGNAAAK